jgi:hypothetical protein
VDKRYQVFVSSTFEDLREERGAVISALLQIDCFPAGMELFPAADDDSLTLIKSVIDDSDYYLIILGGRYGTLDAASGKSYTHLEYEYALTVGKPTIALLHSNPGALPADKTEGSDAGRRLFNDFRAELRKKNCRHLSERGELTAAVFTGVQHLKKTRPGIGWSRATDFANEQLKDELLRVRREMELSNAELEQVKRRSRPAGAEELACGPEKTNIVVEFAEGNPYTYAVSWEEIVRSVLPQTFGAGTEDVGIASALASLVRESALWSATGSLGASDHFAQFVWQGDQSDGGAGPDRGSSSPNHARSHEMVCHSLRRAGGVPSGRRTQKQMMFS